MMRSRLARRLVTAVSIAMLLLCQTAAVAFGYAAPQPASTQAAAAEIATPCHTDTQDADGNTSKKTTGCQDRCPSRDASFETAKINIPAAASLALSVFIVDSPDIVAPFTAAPHEPILACAAPPPLRLAYCRLLI